MFMQMHLLRICSLSLYIWFQYIGILYTTLMAMEGIAIILFAPIENVR